MSARCNFAPLPLYTGKPLPVKSLAIALALDAVYLVGAFLFAHAMLRQLRRRGLVTRYM